MKHFRGPPEIVVITGNCPLSPKVAIAPKSSITNRVVNQAQSYRFYRGRPEMFQLFSNIFASVVSFSGWGASQGAKQAAIYVTDKFGGSGRLSSDGRSRLKNPTLINNVSLKNSCAECHESRDAKNYPDPRGSYRENLQAGYQQL